VRRVVSSERMTVHFGRPRGAGLAGEAPIRFGFTISKKTAKRAHDRNRLKRRLGEIVRLDVEPKYGLSERLDCVVVARPAAVNASYDELRSDLLTLMSSAGLIGVEKQATL
jgi:ribonuclease P protein component